MSTCYKNIAINNNKMKHLSKHMTLHFCRVLYEMHTKQPRDLDHHVGSTSLSLHLLHLFAFIFYQTLAKQDFSCAFSSASYCQRTNHTGPPGMLS